MCDDPMHAHLLSAAGRMSQGGLYLNNGDWLYLSCRNVVSGGELRLDWETFDPDSGLVPGYAVLDPTADRQMNNLAIPMMAGWLVALNLTAGNGLVAREQVWVKLELMRTNPDRNYAHLTLLEGTLTSDGALCWPPTPVAGPVPGRGNVRLIAGTDQAAGVEISETVPNFVRWVLKGLRATLVSAAAAATRQVHLTIDDGTTVLMDLPANATQIISLTRNYNALPLGVLPAATDAEIYIPLPPDLTLYPGYRIKTVTTALNAGDNWGAPQLYVEEWLER